MRCVYYFSTYTSLSGCSDSRVSCKSRESETKMETKARENVGSVSFPKEGLVHPSLSGSTSGPDMGMAGFSLRQEGKLPGQAVNT